jgi:hypothetical protein
MQSGFSRFLIVSVACLLLFTRAQKIAAQNAPKNGGDFSTNTQAVPESAKVPQGVILVKGAWSSASDSSTPDPEGGSVVGDTFRDPYFGLSYQVPKDWIEKYKGPPPSDSGRYVLLQLQPAESFKGTKGSILITAQDMFFSPLPGKNAWELVNYEKSHLQADHKLELAPTETKVSSRPFVFFAYWSPIAQLHWYVLATEIRCHEVEMVVTSRDTQLLQNLVLQAEHMQLPAEGSSVGGTGGGDVPVCIKDYATDDNVISRVDPIFAERTFNPVPVRIIIDKSGNVKHIHFLSAFPSQSAAITAALKQWKFKPYRRNGKPVELETGIMFGRAPHAPTSAVE